MESQPQNPEFSITPENFNPCTYYLNSGKLLYLSNSSSHACWEPGGAISLNNFQSTIDRPDSVNLKYSWV